MDSIEADRRFGAEVGIFGIGGLAQRGQAWEGENIYLIRIHYVRPL